MTRFLPTAKAQAVAALLHQDLAKDAQRVDRLKARDLGPAQVEWLHRQFEAQLRSLCDIRRAAREKAADLPRHKRRVALLDLDPVRIRQVLDNLIANAVRHTAAGGDVQIDARLTATAIQVSVKDTGDGIPAEDLPHIFDRFWKSKDSGGSGLGLAIAKGVVTAHGGTISADSSVGTGTIIRISLPREILISGATVPRP